MRVRLFLFFSFLLFNFGAVAQASFEKQVQHFIARPDFHNARIGIHLVDQETGKTLFGLNSESLFTPASVMKVITTATALEILGPDYRFLTKIGYRGKIENGVLKGDLIITGGGDPALGSEYFISHYFSPHFLEVWTEQIKVSGIRRVEGNLILNGSIYDQETIPPTWIWEDMGNYYGSGVSALTVYDNLLRIRFRSPERAGEPTEIISVLPAVKGLDFKNEVLSSDINRDLAYVFGSPLDGSRVIRGTIPKNRKSFTIKASNPFPEKLLADDFLFHLSRSGVFITGETVETTAEPLGFNLIYMTESPALAEIVKVLNYESVNLFAEHLVKQIAAETGSRGSREAGLRQITDFWRDKGLDINQLIMEDGSGLSHLNAVSPEFLTSVIQHMMTGSENSRFFSASLPGSGQGTLYYFNPEKLPVNHFRAKSGTLSRVRCFAGTLQAQSGKEIVFAVMLNYFTGSHQKLAAELENLFLSMREAF